MEGGYCHPSFSLPFLWARLTSWLDHMTAAPYCGSCPTLAVSFLQSAAAAPSPVMGTMAPNDAMAPGPVAPGFFQVWVPGASIVPIVEVGGVLQARLQWNGCHHSGCEHVRTLSKPVTGIGL